MNFISEQEDVLNEKDIYPYFLGMRSNYYKQDFNSFLDHYSVKINTDYIIVFNDDGVPYEDYTNDDFSYLPKELLDFNEKQLKDWIDKEVDIHLKRVDKNKEEEREYIKSQINILTKKLEQL